MAAREAAGVVATSAGGCLYSGGPRHAPPGAPDRSAEGGASVHPGQHHQRSGGAFLAVSGRQTTESGQGVEPAGDRGHPCVGPARTGGVRPWRHVYGLFRTLPAVGGPLRAQCQPRGLQPPLSLEVCAAGRIPAWRIFPDRRGCPRDLYLQQPRSLPDRSPAGAGSTPGSTV